MSIYDYYAVDYNKLEERLQEQNKSNIRLELELKATKAQFEDVFDYFKKESRRVEQLKTVIEQLTATKSKSDTIFPSVEVLINTSWHFVHTLSLATNKSQPTSRIFSKKIFIFIIKYLFF